MVAQSVEQGTENPRVGGSIPPQGTRCGYNSVVECDLAKVEVEGSNPFARSKIVPIGIEIISYKNDFFLRFNVYLRAIIQKKTDTVAKRFRNELDKTSAEGLTIMINADSWMVELTDKLKAYFKNRLLFVGLQGSHQREEAHQDSDIDAVVILDTLSIDDLIAYRKILLTMPENDKACGFIGGKQELMNWPKHELFQFEQDTRSYHGILDELLPNTEHKDVIDSVKISASGLYHSCCHAAVHFPLEYWRLKKHV